MLLNEDASNAKVQLEAVHGALYEKNEKEAFQNAGNESWRYWREEFKLRTDEDAQRKLEKAHPWIHQLWEEQKGGELKRSWGYAVYWSPDCADTTEREEEYERNMSSVLFAIRSRISLSDALGSGWALERLDWPADDVDFEKGFQERLAALRKNFRQTRALPRTHRVYLARKQTACLRGFNRMSSCTSTKTASILPWIIRT